MKGTVPMELIVISDSKLKIMLTAPDMIRYDLAGSGKTCADPKTRAAFRHLFHDARQRIGFDTEGERLLVQMYTSREGGCEIFVTKLGARPLPTEALPMESFPMEMPPMKSRPTEPLQGEQALWEEICRGEAAESSEEESLPLLAYGLERVGDLVGLCRALKRLGYEGESRAYIEETGRGTRWHLLLTPREWDGITPSVRFGVGGEFGTEESPWEAALYLAEYGRCICSDMAVEVLGGL